MTKRLILIAILIPALSSAADKLNPDLSINALGLFRNSNFGNTTDPDAPKNGFHLQEAEIRATSNIDAYFRGEAIFSVEKENDGTYVFNPEEIFIETLTIPGATLRAGLYEVDIDRHNHLHAHSFPFIDSPISNQIILGEEGLVGTGLAAAILIPASWYFEIIPQVYTTDNETLFNSTTQDDVGNMLFVKNLWDLSESSTLEIDLGYGTGRNNTDGLTQVGSAALVAKWRPVEKTIYRSFSWTAQFLTSDRENNAQQITRGYSTWFQWQFDRRWWFQGRTEAVGYPHFTGDESVITHKNSWLFAFVPTEQSAIRLQYDNVRAPTKETEHIYSLQFNVSMGAHPAHNY